MVCFRSVFRVDLSFLHLSFFTCKKVMETPVARCAQMSPIIGLSCSFLFFFFGESEEKKKTKVIGVESKAKGTTATRGPDLVLSSLKAG